MNQSSSLMEAKLPHKCKQPKSYLWTTMQFKERPATPFYSGRVQLFLLQRLQVKRSKYLPYPR